MPIILDTVIFGSLLGAEVHAVTASLLFEKDGSLRTNALAWLIDKDLHVILFHIYQVDCLSSASNDERESVKIKLWKSS